MKQGPDKFLEYAFVCRRREQRLRLGADFPVPANKSCYLGVHAGCAEKIQDRFGRGYARCIGARGCQRGHECQRIQEDLEEFAVIHGVSSGVHSVGSVRANFSWPVAD